MRAPVACDVGERLLDDAIEVERLLVGQKLVDGRRQESLSRCLASVAESCCHESKYELNSTQCQERPGMTATVRLWITARLMWLITQEGLIGFDFGRSIQEKRVENPRSSLKRSLETHKCRIKSH